MDPPSKNHELNEFIVKAYLAFRLQRSHAKLTPLQEQRVLVDSLQNNSDASSTANISAKRMCSLALDFENRYKSKFPSPVAINRLDENSTSPRSRSGPVSEAELEAARSSFQMAVDELFKGGWKWSRVVALFGYAGVLADCVASTLDPSPAQNHIASIAEWTVKMLDSPNGSEFFESTDGWDGFVMWSAATLEPDGTSRPKTVSPEVVDEVHWSMTRQLALVGLAAATFAGLSIIVSRLVSS